MRPFTRLALGVLALGPLFALSTVVAQEANTGDLTLPQKTTDIPEPESDEKAIEIVEKYLEAIGGRDVLNAIQDKTMVFETTKYAPTGNTKAKLQLFRKRGYKVREQWDIPGFQIKDEPLKFVQVYDGFDGWVQMFGTVSPLEGRTLSIFVWDKPIADFFMTWKEDGYSLAYLGEGEVNGEPVEVVQCLDFTQKNRVRYFFSKKTGLILKKQWREDGRDGSVSKEDFYKSWAPIAFRDDASKKLMVALRHEIMKDGKPDTDRTYSSFVINSGLDDSIFAKPKGVPFQKAAAGGGSPLDQIKKMKAAGDAGEGSK